MKNSWLVLVAILVGVSLAHAESYKWTDKDGKVHYSDQKPDASKADPEKTVENPGLDKGNFVSAKDAGLVTTDEEKKRWAEQDAKKKEEEAERLKKEEAAARQAEKEAETKTLKEEEENDNSDDEYYRVDFNRVRPVQLPTERPRRPVQ